VGGPWVEGEGWDERLGEKFYKTAARQLYTATVILAVYSYN